MAGLKGRALFACIVALTSNSFLLIGFDNGVLGGLVNQPAFLDTFDNPDPTTLGLIVALYEVGCFFGAIGAALFGERIGRRYSMFTGALIMLVGAVLQATAYTRAHMIVARIVSGLGMGLINSSAPVYQSEFSPKATRGLYACCQLSTLNFGIFITYWIDYGFAGQTDSYAWRIPVILQCVFIIPVAVLAFVLPETPRWLVAHNRDDEAYEIMIRLNSHRQSPEQIDELFSKLQKAVQVEDQVQERGLGKLFKSDEIRSRKRLLIACGIQFFQQLGGINGIIYYSGTIFSSSIGFDAHSAALMSGFLFTWFFVASFIPWFLIDRIGRRPLFLSMISLMAAVFAIEAGLISQIQYKTSISHACGAAAAAMLFIYIGAFTIGFQATVWVYPPEILPLRLRQTGTALATASNWIINFMVVQVTPVGIANIGWRYYIIYAIFNACFVPIIYLFFPETKGLELEEIDSLFATGTAAQELREDGLDPKVPGKPQHVENGE